MIRDTTLLLLRCLHVRWPRLPSLSRALALYAAVAPSRFRGRGRNRGEVQSPAGDAEALDVKKAGALRGDAPRRRAFVETVSTTVIALETSRRVLVLPRVPRQVAERRDRGAPPRPRPRRARAPPRGRAGVLRRLPPRRARALMAVAATGRVGVWRASTWLHLHLSDLSIRATRQPLKFAIATPRNGRGRNAAARGGRGRGARRIGGISRVRGREPGAGPAAHAEHFRVAQRPATGMFFFVRCSPGTAKNSVVLARHPSISA